MAPRGGIVSHTSSQRVSFLCMSSQGCAYLALCANGFVRWIFSQGLRPLHDCSVLVGLVSTYESRGFTPHPCLHSMFSLVGTLYVVWCGSQFCGGCWCIVCGGVWLGLAFGVGVVRECVGVVRECFVPTYGCCARTRASGGWLLVGACLVRAFLGMGVVWSWRVVGGVFVRAHLRGVFWWWLAGWWVWRFEVLGVGLAGGSFHGARNWWARGRLAGWHGIV